MGAHARYRTDEGCARRLSHAPLDRVCQHGAAGKSPRSVDADHLGYGYPSLRMLLENGAALGEQSLKPSLYYADPEGNQMEFQVDRLESSDDASQFIATMFAKNPLGEEFDPEDWLARLRSGTPESELLDRTTHEPVSPLHGVIAQFISAS